MHKIYKDDITNMNWRLLNNNNWNIEKKDVGGNQYEYTVTFTATPDILKRTDPKQGEVGKILMSKAAPSEPKARFLRSNMVKIFGIKSLSIKL